MGRLERSIPCPSLSFLSSGGLCWEAGGTHVGGQTPPGGLAASLPAVSPVAATALLPASDNASQTKSRLFSASFKPSATPFTTFSQNKDKERDGLSLEGVKGQIRPPSPGNTPTSRAEGRGDSGIPGKRRLPLAVWWEVEALAWPGDGCAGECTPAWAVPQLAPYPLQGGGKVTSSAASQGDCEGAPASTGHIPQGFGIRTPPHLGHFHLRHSHTQAL